MLPSVTALGNVRAVVTRTFCRLRCLIKHTPVYAFNGRNDDVVTRVIDFIVLANHVRTYVMPTRAPCRFVHERTNFCREIRFYPERIIHREIIYRDSLIRL